MISSLFKFLDANHSKVFWGYIAFILLVVVLPLNGISSHALNNVYIVEIRLDHLLHGILFSRGFYKHTPLQAAVVGGGGGGDRAGGGGRGRAVFPAIQGV